MTTTTLPSFDKRAILDELDRLRDAFGDPDLAECEMHFHRESRTVTTYFAASSMAHEALIFEKLAERGGRVLRRDATENGVAAKAWFFYLWRLFPASLDSYGESSERVHCIGKAAKYSRLAIDELRKEVASVASDDPPAPVPIKRLIGWPAIFSAIEMAHSNEAERSIARYNDKTEGPINSRRGKKPWADRDALVLWWNGLEKRLSEIDQRATDREAATADTYEHGKGGVVAPIIGGEVKQKRSGMTKGRKR